MELQHLRYKLPDIRFFLFGMGQRPKFIYRDGRLASWPAGTPVRHWNVKSDRIVPPDHLIDLETRGGTRTVIREDEAAVWVEENGERTALGGTRRPVRLPQFAGHPYARVLRVLHQEVLVNITEAGPVPNFFVYGKPWYRDGAMMALAFRETGNLGLIRDWILHLREPYDRNNNGETEADNLGRALFLISLASDKQHPLVAKVLAELSRFETNGPDGTFIRGRSDFAEHPVYQNCILRTAGKFERLGICRRPADCKSAIRQTSSLRYDERSTAKRIRRSAWTGSSASPPFSEITFGNQSKLRYCMNPSRHYSIVLAALGLFFHRLPTQAASQLSAVRGIYPHLAMFNNEAECGTGAVVPWADRLWVITYGPHLPKGSSDKLYEIDTRLNQVVRPESVGGTPANRMIHRESQQLFIGPYVIDARRNVRVIPPGKMFGRHTGNARHLTDPAGKIYYATMEEGLYEVDVKTLEVTELWADEQLKTGRHASLPGYHGKGIYSGQGRLIYANNGEHGTEALSRPEIPSGALAEWDGKTEAWSVVRRNQFTDVTGPGGIYGNGHPARDPVWSIGWDHRSLILMLLDSGEWHAYRLPKASHCYDGAHGWNTEWPRIRDIGGRDLLMTMHGMFWRFPKNFSRANSAGVAPRSTYLKVIGDFCRWNDRVVFGCDDTAKNEFLNRRKAKGNLAGPGQSQSNLWFVEPDELDSFGAPLGRGAVWLDEPVKAGEWSEAFLFSGFERRGIHLTHEADSPITFTIDADRRGNSEWTKLRKVTVPAHGYTWVEFKSSERGAWVRVRVDRDCPKATALFNYSDPDGRSTKADSRFDGLAKPTDVTVSGGLIRARGDNLRTLAFAAFRAEGGPVSEAGYYEMGADLALKRVNDPPAHQWLKQNAPIPRGVLTVDEASVVFVDDQGRRWRLPKGDPAFDQPGVLADERVDREVCTERDLFNAHGTFYELPAENAGGFAKIRPVTTHNRRIKDYCSYRGLLVLSGVSDNAPAHSSHVVRSDDGQCALWVGVVDDLWKLGKPRGTGGPWMSTAVKGGEPSDPYLMTGYDRKSLRLSHTGADTVGFRVEVDLTGTGLWRTWTRQAVPPAQTVQHRFPEALQAYWIRVVAERACTATAQLNYN